MDIATPLRQARERKGWAQYEVSERIGIALRTLARWEAPDPEMRRMPDVDEFVRWCRVLDIDPADLLREVAAEEVAG